jgi:hypothetical protein
VHGVQGEAELGAIVGDALVGAQDVLELRRIALVARLGLVDVVDGEVAEFLEAAGVLFLEGAAALEEAGEVLRGVSWARAVRGRAPTRALAMLALRRLSSVDTPTSECRTSCTRCCVCASWPSVRCSGDAGAKASIGDDSAASSAAAGAVLKSGLKLSPVATGGIE